VSNDLRARVGGVGFNLRKVRDEPGTIGKACDQPPRPQGSRTPRAECKVVAPRNVQKEKKLNPHSILPERFLGDAIPLAFVGLFVALVILPAVTFGIARKWSANQPEQASGALAGAVIVSVVGILCAAFLALAVIGWIPPLGELVGRG
jgi:hypothetical protein